jgi:AmmeMemoRadiSam system protein B
MKIRETQLAGSWYPDSGHAVNRLIDSWSGYIGREPRPRGRAVAAVVPHAGWVFSGKLAARVLARAAASHEGDPPTLVVVLGGHLGPGDPVVVYGEEAWDTPLGPIALDLAPNALLAGFEPRQWPGPTNDNTVEVLLPLVKAYFPGAAIWPLRVPPAAAAERLGEALYAFMRDRPEPALVVASTDLTHYGQAYGFAPAGPGEAGEEFRRKNDRAFVEAALALDPGRALAVGHKKKAACSAGAAAAALRLASLFKAQGLEVDSYASSDVMPGPQSVGYAGLEFVLAS